MYKNIEFQINGKKYILVDLNDFKIYHMMLTHFGHVAISLMEITDEEAYDIIGTSKLGKKPIDELNSFLETLDCYLYNNPYSHPNDIPIQPASLNWWLDTEKKHLEAKKKTYINPYIILK